MGYKSLRRRFSWGAVWGSRALSSASFTQHTRARRYSGSRLRFSASLRGSDRVAARLATERERARERARAFKKGCPQAFGDLIVCLSWAREPIKGARLLEDSSWIPEDQLNKKVGWLWEGGKSPSPSALHFPTSSSNLSSSVSSVVSKRLFFKKHVLSVATRRRILADEFLFCLWEEARCWIW